MQRFGMLLECFWNAFGTLVEHVWNTRGTLLEHLWNACGTLVERFGTLLEDCRNASGCWNTFANALRTLLEQSKIAPMLALPG